MDCKDAGFQRSRNRSRVDSQMPLPAKASESSWEILRASPCSEPRFLRIFRHCCSSSDLFSASLYPTPRSQGGNRSLSISFCAPTRMLHCGQKGKLLRSVLGSALMAGGIEGAAELGLGVLYISS